METVEWVLVLKREERRKTRERRGREKLRLPYRVPWYSFYACPNTQSALEE